jgi:hypothetical protein
MAFVASAEESKRIDCGQGELRLTRAPIFGHDLVVLRVRGSAAARLDTCVTSKLVCTLLARAGCRSGRLMKLKPRGLRRRTLFDWNGGGSPAPVRVLQPVQHSQTL